MAIHGPVYLAAFRDAKQRGMGISIQQGSSSILGPQIWVHTKIPAYISQCRQSWAKEIHEKEWGFVLRAEVYLRKQLWRQPCEEEVQIDLIERNAHSDKKKVYKDLVTINDIGAAIADGLIVRLP